MLNTSGSYRVKKGLESDRDEAIYLISIHLFLLQFLKHYFLAKALKWRQINYKSRNYNLKAEVSRWNQIYCNFSIGLNEGVKWVLGIYASLLQWNGNPPLPSLTFPISQLIGQKRVIVKKSSPKNLSADRFFGELFFTITQKSPLWQRLNKFITRDKAKLNK